MSSYKLQLKTATENVIFGGSNYPIIVHTSDSTKINMVEN